MFLESNLLWSGSWTSWSPQVPSNLNVSVSVWSATTGGISDLDLCKYQAERSELLPTTAATINLKKKNKPKIKPKTPKNPQCRVDLGRSPFLRDLCPYYPSVSRDECRNHGLFVGPVRYFPERIPEQLLCWVTQLKNPHIKTWGGESLLGQSHSIINRTLGSLNFQMNIGLVADFHGYLKAEVSLILVWGWEERVIRLRVK